MITTSTKNIVEFQEMTPFSAILVHSNHCSLSSILLATAVNSSDWRNLAFDYSRMGKVKVNRKLQSYVDEFESDSVFEIRSDSALFCKKCLSVFSVSQKSHVEQHINGAKHKSRFSRLTSQPSIVASFSKQKSVTDKRKEYNMELTASFCESEYSFERAG